MTIVRAGIFALITFAVLSFGAVQSWSQTILEIGAALLLVLWAVAKMREQPIEISANWILIPIAGIPLIAAIQLIGGLSIYAYSTKVELLKWIAYLILCFLAVQSVRTLDQLKSFAWFLIILSFSVSLLAIAQHFAGNGKLFWFMELREGLQPFGPYINRDHFAGFVELTAPVGAALLLFRGVPREKLPLVVILTLVPIGALILSASRGGIIGFIFECLLLVIFRPSREAHGKRWFGTAAMVVLAAGFAAWLGITPALERFTQLANRNITRDQRITMDIGTLRLIRYNKWTGTGLGTFQEAYPRYETIYDPLTVDHAHNDYLELVAETGVAGGLCGAAFIVLLATRGYARLKESRSREERAIYAGALAACAGLLLHSAIDFNLYIPANVLIFLLLATLATTRFTAGTNYAGTKAEVA